MTGSYIPGLFPPRQPEELIYVVREATSGGDRRNLARLLSRIYRGDRYWSPLSRRRQTRALSPKHNPSLQVLPVGLFVAEARNGVVGDEIIGGIAVWPAENAGEQTVAHFGMFEVVNNPEVGEALIEAAEFWLMEHSPAEAICGPFSLDEHRAPGLLADGFNTSPGPFLPYNPPYYPEMVEHAGYETSSETYAFTLPANPLASAWKSVHTFDPEDNPEVWARFIAGAETLQRVFVSAHPGALGLQTAAGRSAVGVVLLPNGGGPVQPSRLRGWPFQHRDRRLLALPIGEPVDEDAETALRELYAAVAYHAYQIGVAEVLCAPIRAEHAAILHALESLGARKVQTYRIYEKRF